MTDEQSHHTSTESTGDSKANEQAQQDAFVWGDGLNLDVVADKMSARLEIALTAAEHYTPEDVIQYLNENNLVSSVDAKAVHHIFDEGLYNQSVVVAKGIPPQNGNDGYVEWDVDLSILEGARLVERAGRVDWKERHHVLQVSADQRLARLVEPTMGEAGVNVYGEEVPSTPGKPAKFPAGKGVRISEDGQELYADVSGAVCMDGEKIAVSPIYNIQGDVNLKTGNVDFEESVVISGGVLSDFIIHAGQDIHINGLVEAAELAAGGNIYINGGVQGNLKAVIHASGNVVAKYLNNAKIKADGDVYVQGSITNSIVQCKGKLMVEGNKSVIVGGHICAEKEISADVIGSQIGSRTILELGAEVVVLMDARKDLEKKCESLLANYNKLRHAATLLNKLRDSGKINEKQEELRLKLIRGALNVQGQIKKMKKEIEHLDKQIRMSQLEQIGIVAKSVAWPGVILKIMNQKFVIKTMTTKAIFALKGKEIEAYAYKEDELKRKKEKIQQKKSNKEEYAPAEEVFSSEEKEQ